jgi:hypothetical protein
VGEGGGEDAVGIFAVEIESPALQKNACNVTVTSPAVILSLGSRFQHSSIMLHSISVSASELLGLVEGGMPLRMSLNILPYILLGLFAYGSFKYMYYILMLVSHLGSRRTNIRTFKPRQPRAQTSLAVVGIASFSATNSGATYLSVLACSVVVVRPVLSPSVRTLASPKSQSLARPFWSIRILP